MSLEEKYDFIKTKADEIIAKDIGAKDYQEIKEAMNILEEIRKETPEYIYLAGEINAYLG